MWTATVLLDLMISFTCLTAGIIFVTFCYRLVFWYQERQQAKENERRMRNPNLATEEFINNQATKEKEQDVNKPLLAKPKNPSLKLATVTQTPPDFVSLPCSLSYSVGCHKFTTAF